MGHPAALVLALAVGAAAAYCLARCVVPRWRGGHGVGVDAWHVAMGTAMVAMLVAPVGRGSAAVQAAAFALAALWCAGHLLVRSWSGLVAVALVAGAAIRSAVATAQGDTAHRLSLACEVTMAGAMGYMVALAL